MVNIKQYDEVGREKIREYLGECKLIADLGCNKEKIRKDAHGYDIDLTVGADFICDLNNSFPFFEYDYNGICMSHFLEHSIDTRRLLQECYDNILNGGRIAVTVPDGETVCPETLGDSNNTHEMLFTPTTLKLYLENAGFTNVVSYYYDRPTAYKQTKGIFAGGIKNE